MASGKAAAQEESMVRERTATEQSERIVSLNLELNQLTGQVSRSRGELSRLTDLIAGLKEKVKAL